MPVFPSVPRVRFWPRPRGVSTALLRAGSHHVPFLRAHEQPATETLPKLTRSNVKELKSPSCSDTVPLWPEFHWPPKDAAMTDADFMRMAIQTAREGMGKGEMPFGACIVHKGKVLAVAHNSAKADIDTTAHGEAQAIRSASRQLSKLNLIGATIYTTCEPCPMCFAACLWANSGGSCMPAALRMRPRPGSGRFPSRRLG